METKNAIIIYNYSFSLNITEDLLKYINIQIFATTNDSNNVDTLVQYATNFNQEEDEEFQEVNLAYTNIYFKFIDTNNYLVCLDFGIYTETETEETTSFYGKDIDLLIVVGYLNTKGKYEIQKYEIQNK